MKRCKEWKPGNLYRGQQLITDVNNHSQTQKYHYINRAPPRRECAYTCLLPLHLLTCFSHSFLDTIPVLSILKMDFEVFNR